MRKTVRLLIIGLLVTANAGCVSLLQPKTSQQIPYEIYGDIHAANHVTVLLPGIRNRVEDFTDEGFIQIAAPLLQEFPGNALIAVDAHWGYYRERIIDQRLQQDILQRYPHKTFTFVGISLGGFGSLLMATQHSERIDKLVLLSPFMGEDDYAYLARLQTLGIVDQEGDEDLQRSLNSVWRFMASNERKMPIYIAYGQDDDFVPYYDHLRGMQPPRVQFLEIRGGHDWGTWRTLWKTLAPMAFMQY